MSSLAEYNDAIRAAQRALQLFEAECDKLAGVSSFDEPSQRAGHANGKFSQALATAPGTLDYSTLSGLVLSGPGPTERRDFGQLDPDLLIEMLAACPPLYQQLLDFGLDDAPILAASAVLQTFVDGL